MQQLNTLAVDDSLIHDLQQIENKLQAGVRSSLTLPRELSDRLVLAGGKRIRPLLMCLTYRSLKHHKARADLEDLYTLAAVAEWVHTATLFHDDVLDASPTRRNMTAAHMLHGNKIAILVGDFVYAEAFSLLMDRGLLDASRELATTIKSLVEGELLQHQVSLSRSLDLLEYDAIAQAKTAALFAWCTGVGAWVAGHPNIAGAKAFGNALGFAFQMADDLLDTYTFDPNSGDLKALTEWTESAPPFPVVVASTLDPRVNGLWKNLKADAEVVNEIQNICREPMVVSSCQEILDKVLRDAEKFLKELGGTAELSSSLQGALDIIAARATEGIAAAKARPSIFAR